MEVDQNTNESVVTMQDDGTQEIDNNSLNESVEIKPKDEKIDTNLNTQENSDKSNDNGKLVKKNLSEHTVKDEINLSDSLLKTNDVNDKENVESTSLETDTSEKLTPTVAKNISVNKMPEIKISPPDADPTVESKILVEDTKKKVTHNFPKDSTDSVSEDSIIEETILIASLESSNSTDENNESLDDTNGTIEYDLVSYAELSDGENELLKNKSKNEIVLLEKSTESSKIKVIDSSNEPLPLKVIPSDKDEKEKVESKQPVPQNPVKTQKNKDTKQRSLIEDIFEDWSDENNEDESSSQELPKSHDDVEHQLSLLAGEKQKDNKIKTLVPPVKKIQNPPSKKFKLKIGYIKKQETSQPKTPILNKSKEIVEAKSRNLPQTTPIVKSNKKDDSLIKKNKDDQSVVTIPALIRLETTDKKIKIEESNIKKDSCDNTDLLAILEGDVDPDWSDLKPIDEDIAKRNANSNEKNLQKSPLTERELAMKQLLELSTTPPSPATTPKKRLLQKKILQNTPSIKNESDNKDSSNQNSTKTTKIDLTLDEKELSDQEDKTEETRSGRKRKPTEKAREQEISAKRQKIIKIVKPVISKKNVKKIEETKDTDINDTSSSSLEMLDSDSNSASINDDKSASEAEDTDDEKLTITTLKKQKEDLTINKSPVSKKIVTKKVTKSPVVVMKKTGKKIVGKTPQKKSPTPALTETIKPKKKSNNEIDKLLQDEGVVNLLYDVDQPRTRRLIPVTKSQVKVMDMNKIQRELKIRTKLVRNAVLRLRTSTTSPTKISPRAKRCVSINYDQENQEQSQTPEKSSDVKQEQMRSPQSPTEFMYPAKIRNAADASVIVRRHSSSSFSSASGSPRVSFDGARRDLFTHDNIDDNSIRANKRKISQENKKRIADAKKSKKQPLPVSVTAKKIDNKKLRGPINRTDETSDDHTIVKLSNTNKPNGNTGKTVKTKKNQKVKVSLTKVDNVNEKIEPVKNLTDDKLQFPNKEISVTRHGNLIQLIMTPSKKSKIVNALSLEMMEELREILSILKKDDDCRVVLLTSLGSSFCEGLELSTIIQDDKDIRRTNVQQLAKGVKEFIKCLATFNKPLVAGVQGTAMGLAVTMLPLFDIVIASDKASFRTPYGKLGQIAEGTAIFTLSHLLGSAVTSELLLGGRTLTANEALRAGLVTRVLWPDRFHSELLPSLRQMSEQSSQSMEATKSLLRQNLRTKLDAALESESYLLIQHWCTNECQNAIAAYLDDIVL